MKWILLFTSFVCVAGTAWCQGPDVPEVATWEIQRRGAHVELTGSRRGGMMQAAFAPPADDDHKWFVTLVVKRGEADSEKMRTMFSHDKDIRAWVDPSDAARSTTHYHERSLDDATQADWLAGLRPAIARSGVPVVVLQPPRSGQFGDPKTIVKLFHGVCSGKELASKFRDAIVAYVRALESPDSKLAGIRDGGSIGVPPPFNVPPPGPGPAPFVAPAPGPSGLPFEFPPAVSPLLTADQIRAACPGASAKFVLAAIDAKETSIDVVRLRWEAFKADNAAVDPVVPVDRHEVDESHPIPPGSLHPSACLAIAFGGVVLGWILARLKTWSGARITEFRGILATLRTNSQATNGQVPTSSQVGQAGQLSGLIPRPIVGQSVVSSTNANGTNG